MARGKPEIDKEKCTGCKQCLPVCPQKILAISGSTNKKKRHFAVCLDEELCIACSECAKVCPKYVIRIWSFSIAAGG